MDGFPSGIEGIPPPDSMITAEQRRDYVNHTLSEAEKLVSDTNGEIANTARAYLDSAQSAFGPVLQEQYNAVQDELRNAEKSIQRAANGHAKEVEKNIQGAYDSVRAAGHEPIVDYNTIQATLKEGYPYADTVSRMLGIDRYQAGRNPTVPVVQPGTPAVRESRTGEVDDASQRAEADRRRQQAWEARLERHARRFGSPGEERYEIARHGYPPFRLPDDSYVAPAGTPVIKTYSVDAPPEGYIYSVGSEGYIPESTYPVPVLDGEKPKEDEIIPDCPPGTEVVRGADGLLTCTAPKLLDCPEGQLPWTYPSGETVCVDKDIILPPPPPPPPPMQCPSGTTGIYPNCVPVIPPPPPPPPTTTECKLIKTIWPSGEVETVTWDDLKTARNRGWVIDAISYDKWINTNPAEWGPGVEVSGYDPLTGRTINWKVDSSTCTKPPPPPPPPPLDLSGCFRIIPCDAPIPPPTTPPPPPPPAEPKPPTPPPPPGPPLPSSKAVGWDSPDRCRDILSVWQEEPQPPEEQKGSYVAWKFEQWADAAAAQYEVAPTLWAWVPKLVETFDRGVAMVFEAAKTVMDDILNTSIPSLSVETNIAIGSAQTLGIATWLERITGVPMQYFTQDVRYKMQWASPQFIPQQADLDLLYLTDRINDEAWECWTRAHGNLPNSHRMARDAKQTRTGVAEIIELRMRGHITAEEMGTELRKRGVIDPVEIERWMRLRVALPTETDLIPFMTRDVVNPGIDWSKSDEWFDQNYRGPVREWGTMLGIDPVVMQMRARAHWQLPSNTALYEMMARLRPGRREDGLTVTMDDARRLLQQNDMEPSWLDKVLAISYLPPTRTDIKQGIKTRSIKSIEEAEKLLLDARIDPTYAPTLARILWDDAQRQTANESNLWSRAKVMKEYSDGMIDRAKATELLGRFMASPEQIQDQLDDADDKVGITIRRECVKAVKNRVLRAEITELEASTQLEQLGIPRGRAIQIAQGFVCYRASRGTELTIRYLSKIWRQGLLTPEELYIRFLNLRYTEEDASLLLRSWQVELTTEQRKEAVKEQKARETEERSARSRYRTEVAWWQKQIDRLKKEQKADPPGPITAVDTGGQWIPPAPVPPRP